MKIKKKKICFISSSGGHFSELCKLKKIADNFNSFLVVEKVENFSTDFCKQKYYLREINRQEKFFLFHFLSLCFKELKIFLKEKPDYIITTGALCAFPMMKIAKFFNKKIIYIESYARVYDLSLTGKKLYGSADLFVVQWPDLVEQYPKAKYYGSLFDGEI